MNIDYQVPGIVVPVDQGSSNNCWAATSTILLSWKDKTSYSMESAIKKQAKDFLEIFESGSGLPSDKIHEFSIDFGFKTEAPVNYSYEGWTKLLREFGLLIVFVEGGGANDGWSHAVVLKGIKGDGKPKTTNFYLIDPAGGKTITESHHDFSKRYEASDPMDLPFQVIHW